MNLRLIPPAILLTTLSVINPVLAENLQDTRQLLTSRQCPNCDLRGAGLVWANLAGADLTGANLMGANLSRANLQGADLRGANLSGASLFGANLTGANLAGVIVNGTDLRNAYLMGADLTGVDLNNAFLIGAIGLSPNNGTAEDFYRLGVAEAKAGNYQNAIAHYNHALSLKPDLAAAYFGRGMARADLGDYPGALEDAERSRQLYVSQGSPEGEQVSQQLIEVIQVYQNPNRDKPKGGFLGVLESAVPLLFRLLF